MSPPDPRLSSAKQVWEYRGRQVGSTCRVLVSPRADAECPSVAGVCAPVATIVTPHDPHEERPRHLRLMRKSVPGKCRGADVLRVEWEALEAELEGLDSDARLTRLRAFHDRLASMRVLDPACGTGNFLYVAMKSLLGVRTRSSAGDRGFGRRSPLADRPSAIPWAGEEPESGQNCRVGAVDWLAALDYPQWGRRD